MTTINELVITELINRFKEGEPIKVSKSSFDLYIKDPDIVSLEMKIGRDWIVMTPPVTDYGYVFAIKGTLKHVYMNYVKHYWRYF